MPSHIMSLMLRHRDKYYRGFATLKSNSNREGDTMSPEQKHPQPEDEKDEEAKKKQEEEAKKHQPPPPGHSGGTVPGSGSPTPQR